jgi:IS4 transposase
VSNLAREQFSVVQVSDTHRLRWQIELWFKEWKSYLNVHALGTNKASIVEGFIWASLCAATLNRYWAHVTQRLRHVDMSTRKVAMCVHHVLYDILHAMLDHPRRLNVAITRALDDLSRNAKRAHPKRDERTGRHKSGLVHLYEPLKT